MRKIILILTAMAWLFFIACGGDGGNGISINNYMPDLIEKSEALDSWSGYWKSSNGVDEGSISFDLTRSDTLLEGSASMSGFSCMTDGNISGISSGNNVTFDVISVSKKDIINFSGTSNLTKLSGSYAVINWACALDHGTFTVTKQ